ncbi:hypothetical protein Pint_05009 [Pistacia integerrima]|uniref:Uncharacterized protein n=1 Tax=Pistacia integerrima TaxID=434235 RepID=A0ACC0Z3C5_9ROSI|nr:hypothetical protein Pint_05009 [Pistacia integerrima]
MLAYNMKLCFANYDDTFFKLASVESSQILEHQYLLLSLSQNCVVIFIK